MIFFISFSAVSCILVKIILKRKLDIDSHAALRIGVGIQMEG